MLNYLTPHGKWHIHSTYCENHRMLTLSRGVEPFWMNDKDAEKLGIVDNDWVEVHNDHGVVLHPRRRHCPHSRGHLHHLSLARAHHRRAEVAAPGQPARGRPQQPHAGPPQAPPHGRRLRAVHLPLQLLGPHGRAIATPRYGSGSWSEWSSSSRRRGTERWTSEHRSPWSSTWTSASGATPARSPARTSGPTARAPSTCGGTTWRRSRAPAIRPPGRTRRSTRAAGSGRRTAIEVRAVGKLRGALTVFHNPNLPTIDDYYEPFTYTYADLIDAPEGRRPAHGPADLDDHRRGDGDRGRAQLGRRPRRLADLRRERSEPGEPVRRGARRHLRGAERWSSSTSRASAITA